MKAFNINKRIMKETLFVELSSRFVGKLMPGMTLYKHPGNMAGGS
jgi:hypothetical protein